MPVETSRALVIHAANDLRIEQLPVRSMGENDLRIKIAAGGVCGSDLHYYNHGGFGAITLKEPMILGHEVAGVVDSVGKAVSGFSQGDLVAVSPSRPCNDCKFCHVGLQNQCLNMRFYGSAMPFPHIQGAFREILVADARQCVNANGLSAGEAALGEPFAVALHGVNQAGAILGKRVLVTGCGPIGVLTIIAARRAGAREIIATDLADNALTHAQHAGADITINSAQDTTALDAYTEHKGYFDVHFECSGSKAALASGIATLRPRGTLVQLGLSGDMAVPMMSITAKELQLKGSFRFHEEFALAVDLMQRKLVDTKPLITHTQSLDEAESAFKLANDRSVAMKAQIAFS